MVEVNRVISDKLVKLLVLLNVACSTLVNYFIVRDFWTSY